MAQPFRPAVTVESQHRVIYIVEGAETMAVKAMVGARHNAGVTTLKVIVREKLKALNDIPDVPYQSEPQCAKWLRLVDPDLEIMVGSLEAVDKALACLLDEGQWPEPHAGLRPFAS
jgi:hypothetical protein